VAITELTRGDLPADLVPADVAEARGEPDGDAEAPDAGPPEYEPFFACSKDSPCPFPEDPLCLLLPESEEGICVRPCDGEDSQACPPGQECLTPDAAQPDLKVCLSRAQMNEPCAATAGIICVDGLFCVPDPKTPQAPGICTTYCTMGEAICQQGTECQAMDPDDLTWGACLPLDDLLPCQSADGCPAGTACAALVPGWFNCAPLCPEVGQPCGNYGLCMPLEQPDGETANVCLVIQNEHDICSLKKGMPCSEGLTCVDLGASDGWKRCVAPCDNGNCPDGSVCKLLEGIELQACVPLQFAFGDTIPCGPSLPCEAPDQVCVAATADGNGLCAPSCDSGCTDQTTCLNGGCVLVSPAGGACLEENGVFCEPQALCIRDAGEYGPGACAIPCTPGVTDCGGDQKCTGVLEASFCLDVAGFSELCSLDESTACDPDLPLTCVKIGSDADFGFCTVTCDGPGTCPQELPGIYVECMINMNEASYCGFLCAGMVGDCPEWMECAGFGMCTP